MKLLTFVLFCLLSTKAFAASCCGGGFSIPSLILGDDKSQFTNSISMSNISDDVLSSGKWIRRKDGNLATTYKAEGATLLSDSWQAGFSIPCIEKNANNLDRKQGFGDISLSLAHDTFPELLYSKWKPKGVTFLQLTIPSSPSVYDTESFSSLSVRGRGFVSIGLGVALTKNWNKFDGQFNLGLHRAMPRKFNSEAYGGKIEVIPAWGSSANVGVGINSEKWRIGSLLSFNYEDAIRVNGALNSEGSVQRIYGLTFSSSYMINDESSASLSFADQSLIGSPLNSALSKTINFSLQHRWPR